MTGKFEPKTPVQLNPPKDDPISKEYLAKCNGMVAFNIVIETSFWTILTLYEGTNGYPCYVAIKVRSLDIKTCFKFLPK